MSQDNQAKRFSLVKSLRGVRDSMMDDVAKVTLAVTTTHVWQKANAVIARPALLVSAILKERREAAMTELLGQLNMPSRDEVLSLSQRLTRIEMSLDDVGAGVDQIRRATERPQRPEPREKNNGAAAAKETRNGDR
jgi:hypothetical protein